MKEPPVGEEIKKVLSKSAVGGDAVRHALCTCLKTPCICDDRLKTRPKSDNETGR